jgi:AcrR family transcriptional regulator
VAKKRDELGMKTRLMKAAMTAFIKKGLNRCTMDDVAREADVGKGTSYLYFKSKEELMVVMYEHYALQSLELQKRFVAQAGDMSPRKLLDEICKELLADAIRHRPVFGLWFQFLALSSAPGLRATVKRILAENYRSHSDYLEEILERGIRKGEFRSDINKRAIAVSLTCLLEGLLVRDYAEKELVELENDYLWMTKLILDGISTPTAKQAPSEASHGGHEGHGAA